MLDAQHWIVGLIANDVSLTDKHQHAGIIVEYMNKFGQRHIERYDMGTQGQSGARVESDTVEPKKIRVQDGKLIIKDEFNNDKVFLIAVWKVAKAVGKNLYRLLEADTISSPKKFSKLLVCGNQKSGDTYNCIKYAISTLSNAGIPVKPLPNSPLPLIPSEEVKRQIRGIELNQVVITSLSPAVQRGCILL